MSYVLPEWLRDAVAEFGHACKDRLQDGIGEPEAAIRPPIENLLATIAAKYKHTIVAHGEAPLSEQGVRPDYAIRVDGAVTGYLEVKKPGLSLDPATFRGHNKSQWEQLRDLPDLMYTNGTEWRLYSHGELLVLARLSGDLRTAGRTLTVTDDAFERLTSGFLSWEQRPIWSVNQLVTNVAPLCRLLRSSVLDQLATEARAIRAGADEWEQPFTGLARDWRNLLFPTGSNETFADGYAQTLTFALLLARTENIDFSVTSMHEISVRLGGMSHTLMGKALELLTGSATEQLHVTLDLLKRVIGKVDWGRIRNVANDAYLHLYESFLEVYDPRLREDSGTYYTPYQVVDAMVRLTDEVLRTRMDTPEGFLAPTVTTVDPAMGTGTFINSIIERTARQAAEADGSGAVAPTITDLAKRLIGFELQMGSYAVAEMRVADLLKTYNSTPPADGMRLYVTNTLDDPYVEQTQIAATYAPLARSHRRANEIKVHTPVTVVIGNPPYDEHAQGQGGWVENGGEGTLAPLERFREEGNGRLEYVLKSFYIYFYAWATWKVFDANPGHRNGIVTFISTAGFLTGPGFKGMRRYLRTTCSEGWIINVSPEGIRPDVATRFFPGVQQPLAIAIFARRVDADPSVPANLHYTEVTGRRADKYAQLADLSIEGSHWRPVRKAWDAPFTPAATSGWDDYPALSDLFPWVAPGIKPNRTWVYAPAPTILEERWTWLVTEQDLEKKRELFKKSSDRNIDTEVGPLPGRKAPRGTIATEKGPCPAPVRIGRRSFDRQWIIPDNRVLHRPSPDLWRAALVTGQLFLVEQHARPISSGPGVGFTTLIPDMDYFKGSEGGRVLPLLHPDGSLNVAPGLLAAIEDRLGATVTGADLAAYVAAVTAHPAFTAHFADELVTPGIRIPITADPNLFAAAVALGRELIWAATYGAAFADPRQGRPHNSIAYQTSDPRRVQNLTPIGSALPEEISYDEASQTIRLGEGTSGPVPERVWAYDVGGMKIIQHWFDYRKARPGGRRSSALDGTHVEEWPIEWIREFNELLTVLHRISDLEPDQASMLDDILDGPIITGAELGSKGAKFPASSTDRRPRYGLHDTTDDDQGTLL